MTMNMYLAAIANKPDCVGLLLQHGLKVRFLKQLLHFTFITPITLRS